MKRSEMVEIIQKELHGQSSPNCDIDPDALLTVIEAAGIRPPWYELEVTKENIRELNQNVPEEHWYRYEGDIAMLFEWEKE